MPQRRTDTTQIAVRLSADLLERVDAYAEHLSNERPGLATSRADAVRVLLTMGLDLADKASPRKRKQ